MAGWLGRSCRRLVSALCGVSLWLAVAPANAQDLLVFAAASLQDALDEVIGEYRAQGGSEVSVSYASSSTLTRQIEQGAPADVFISANPEWMDYLVERGLIRAGSRTELLGNGLVLVAPLGSGAAIEIAPEFDFEGVLDGGLLAMGDPEHVPAGIYGRQALESLGVWDAVAPHAARADNVRAALALVARGEAPLGVVYRSDAIADADVEVVGAFPPDSHPPIIYPIAIVAASEHPEATALLQLLQSETAAVVFERFGFTMLD